MTHPWFCECGWKGEVPSNLTEFTCPDCGGRLSEDYWLEHDIPNSTETP